MIIYIYMCTILLFGHIIFLTLEPEIDYLVHVCVRKASRIHSNVPSCSIHRKALRRRNDPGSEAANGWEWQPSKCRGGNRCGKQKSIAFLSHILFMYRICIYHLNTGHEFCSFFGSGGNGSPF